MNSIPLVISLVINAGQLFDSLIKDWNARKIEKQRLDNEKSEKEAQRRHEIKRIELNENIYRSHQTIPEARKICLEYIGATETEIARSNFLPVDFSLEQKELEVKIILYLPNVRQNIENFEEINKAGLRGGIKVFEREFRDGVIPAIANELANFQTEKK